MLKCFYNLYFLGYIFKLYYGKYINGAFVNVWYNLIIKKCKWYKYDILFNVSDYWNWYTVSQQDSNNFVEIIFQKKRMTKTAPGVVLCF